MKASVLTVRSVKDRRVLDPITGEAIEGETQVPDSNYYRRRIGEGSLELVDRQAEAEAKRQAAEAAEQARLEQEAKDKAAAEEKAEAEAEAKPAKGKGAKK